MRIALAVAGALVLSSCQHSENRYLEREVVAGELVGTWSMNPASVKDLRDVGYTAAIDPSRELIVIRADGSCLFDTLPPSIASAGGGKPSPKASAECRWKLDKPPRQRLMLDVSGIPPAKYDYYFDQTKDARLVLWQYIDDPDAWRYVEYLKQ